MVFTTYPVKGERPVTRAEIDRLTAIIAQLNDALDGAVEREGRLHREKNRIISLRNAAQARDAAKFYRLSHECDLQRARATIAEALVGRRRWNDASPAWEHALRLEP